MNTEPEQTDNGQRTTDNGREAEHMSKIEAVGILLVLATKRKTTLDEVIAIQVACRSTLKRVFDRERNRKRRHQAENADTAEAAEAAPPVYFTPKAVQDVIAGDRPLDSLLANPQLNPFTQEVTREAGEAE